MFKFPCFQKSYDIKGGLTVCVRGAWRWGGRGFCLGAEKLEARKMLVNAARFVWRRFLQYILLQLRNHFF